MKFHLLNLDGGRFYSYCGRDLVGRGDKPVPAYTYDYGTWLRSKRRCPDCTPPSAKAEKKPFWENKEGRAA